MRATVWVLALAPCSALLLQPLVLHAQRSCSSRTNAVMESADSSLVSAAAVASALKAEEAQRTRWEAEAELPRAERRKRTSATRDLSQSFIKVGIEPRQAVKYAERLVDRGVRSLEGLDADMIATCGVLAVHREQIKAASLGVSARTARIAAPELVTALGAELGDEVGGEVGEALDAGEEEELGELGEAEEEEEGQERTLTISADLDGKRLDAALAALLPPLGRSYFSSLCSDGNVFVQGAVAKKALKVHTGEEVRVRLRPDRGGPQLVAEDLPLRIIYEDEHMVAIDKDAGLVVHPAPGHPSGTLINALLHRYREAPLLRAEPPEPPRGGAAERASAEDIFPFREGRPASESALSEKPPAEESLLPLPDLFGDGTRPGVRRCGPKCQPEPPKMPTRTLTLSLAPTRWFTGSTATQRASSSPRAACARSRPWWRPSRSAVYGSATSQCAQACLQRAPWSTRPSPATRPTGSRWCASTPPRIHASAPPRLRPSAPPPLRASAPPPLRPSAPPRLRTPAGGREGGRGPRVDQLRAYPRA
jgi:hypothetical protein